MRELSAVGGVFRIAEAGGFDVSWGGASLYLAGDGEFARAVTCKVLHLRNRDARVIPASRQSS